MIENLFNSSRFLVFITISICMFAAFAIYISTLSIIYHLVLELFAAMPTSADDGKRLAVKLLKILDTLLIALTFQIIAISLYRLFIKKNSTEESLFLRVLKISDFHDLKVTLLHVSIVILTILFLEQAVETGAAIESLYFGAAIGLVILAVVYAAKQMSDD